MNHPKTLGQCAGNSKNVLGRSGDCFLGLSNCHCVPFLCVMVSCPKGNVWLHFEPWEAAIL